MRVVLAEDLFILRDWLIRTLKEHGCEVVAVDNGPALLRELLDEDGPGPDVAVVDVRLPPTFSDEGLQAALEARRRRPGLPILVLSQYVEQLYANELLAGGEGAIGYLLKDRVTNTEQFIDAVRRVAAGGTVMDPQVISKLLSRSDARGMIGELTRREREVLELMAEGRSNAAVAVGLHISESAVAKHTASIFGKLQISPSADDNRRVLAVLAYLKR
ncbi:MULTISPECIES: response regulator transcription factor [Streptomyces]|uniref:Response regulator transcription factor n=2 Tax=Streptomyces rimosus subsp. rimosus TaxID=132474 RepID=L8EIE4_STRR1|nr:MULTISPECIES: response regulator transcription factor [Streptomyces]KOG70254.1 LuxR family transcriptional regulator [Kitasatospora aureofaciens]MYT41418.1 response regulator [Streptomyces sp. SID5471]KEF09116.1 LuxR family transcriptional regulator [Streptomyces rimosus]KUJ27915.1 LuxR family transcriptional regulator [Streptomyces rimosus subsp. rimosus]QDA03346.1 DNA-binding response regulator [Streptomyces rimosus]